MARHRLIGFQRGGQIALRHLHVADLLVGHRQIALPVGIGRVSRDQILHDLEGVVGCGERAFGVALCE